MDINKIFDPFAQNRLLWEELQQLNRQGVENLAALLDFQLQATRRYSDLGLSRLRAAAQIQDADSLNTFITGQFEAAALLRQMMMEDAQVLTELSASLAGQGMESNHRRFRIA
ncbi:MAG: phasin family protein [Candidatus Competibacteraceae bacterium]|nr:phasin family protein [Candidatus Competibacteraceae bacterium]